MIGQDRGLDARAYPLILHVCLDLEIFFWTDATIMILQIAKKTWKSQPASTDH